jgi:hypothetical protein
MNYKCQFCKSEGCFGIQTRVWGTIEPRYRHVTPTLERKPRLEETQIKNELLVIETSQQGIVRYILNISSWAYPIPTFLIHHFKSIKKETNNYSLKTSKIYLSSSNLFNSFFSSLFFIFAVFKSLTARLDN